MMSKTRAKQIPSWKHEAVGELSRLMENYPVIGVLDISELPASQFQQIRQKLRYQAEIIVSKNTLVSIAIKETMKSKDPKFGDLSSFLKGQTGIIFTKMNPFKLSKFLRDNKISAPAKPGSKSPRDIVIPAGDTDFAPGPVVGELQRVGIKARIQAGKVVILEDCHLLKSGDTITKEISETLPKFGIMPLELGLKLHAVYEGGMVFTGATLDIDDKKIMGQLQLASVSAFNLALSVNYPTPLTIGLMIVKANAAAQNLALNACLPISQVMPLLLARANAEMLGLAMTAGNKDSKALDAELRDALGIKPPVEEKPAEKPAEEKPKEQ
ncbi:MAG: 50S ribosomal protein L10 [Methanobacteriota archaeon]